MLSAQPTVNSFPLRGANFDTVISPSFPIPSGKSACSIVAAQLVMLPIDLWAVIDSVTHSDCIGRRLTHIGHFAMDVRHGRRV